MCLKSRSLCFTSFSIRYSLIILSFEVMYYWCEQLKASLNKYRNSKYKNRVCGLVVRVPGYTSKGPGFDSRRYQAFWEIIGLERGPLSLVSTIEELLGRNNSGSGLENRESGRGDPLRWPRDTLYQQMLALTSPTYGGRLVGIVRLRAKATEFLSVNIKTICIPNLKMCYLLFCISH
jgi:hypothetical protein